MARVRLQPLPTASPQNRSNDIRSFFARSGLARSSDTPACRQQGQVEPHGTSEPVRQSTWASAAAPVKHSHLSSGAETPVSTVVVVCTAVLVVLACFGVGEGVAIGAEQAELCPLHGDAFSGLFSKSQYASFTTGHWYEAQVLSVCQYVVRSKRICTQFTCRSLKPAPQLLEHEPQYPTNQEYDGFPGSSLRCIIDEREELQPFVPEHARVCGGSRPLHTPPTAWHLTVRCCKPSLLQEEELHAPQSVTSHIRQAVPTQGRSVDGASPSHTPAQRTSRICWPTPQLLEQALQSELFQWHAKVPSPQGCCTLFSDGCSHAPSTHVRMRSGG